MIAAEQPMPSLVLILCGLGLLWAVWSDRRKIPFAWREPARWWASLDEYQRAREPSQPLNVFLGTVLGLAAVGYGIYDLVF